MDKNYEIKSRKTCLVYFTSYAIKKPHDYIHFDFYSVLLFLGIGC